VVLLALFSAACSGRVEQQVLRGYFDTCSAADDVALANVALVALDPKRDGSVGHFRLLRITPSTWRPGEASRRVARLSLFDPLTLHDPERSVLVSEDVDLSVDLHAHGKVREARMTVTLARAETERTDGRWIVVRLVLDGRTLPENVTERRRQSWR
jgi:hypothetical protein